MALDPLYWLAGILEGEGTFMSGPPSRPNSPVVRISMTDRDVVERSAALLDRAVTPVRARQAHYKPPFITQLRGGEAVDLMLAMRPVLGPERTAQIDRVLARWTPRGVRSQAKAARFPVLAGIDGSTNTDLRALSWLAGETVIRSSRSTCVTARSYGGRQSSLRLPPSPYAKRAVRSGGQRS